MHVRTTTVTVLLAAAMLTACGSSDDTNAKTKTSPSAAKPTASESTAETSPETDEPYSFGTPMDWGNDAGSLTGTTTVLGYEQPISSVGSAAEETGEKGYVWGALEVKVCTDKGKLLVTNTDMTLAYKDGARVEASSSTWDDFPKPEFPIETEVRAGDCVRGKTVFPVPSDQRPEKAMYAPGGASEMIAEWTVPAKD
ncbi:MULTISPECIES: hypothetical protein [Streptomyces]|uniref:Lipoprotein n=2 Tax=Streptomyces TaxID=1883 RepID=A0A3M8X013_9ACTN|nr:MULTISPECIES: hypothetical protein [Streptomyces]MCQ8190123.1 hypothetical protein [Streptomyces rugosispiralis]RNG34301.1 hypothetical protein EEJ42_05645 [Streptomyces botrytidirepellens]